MIRDVDTIRDEARERVRADMKIECLHSDEEAERYYELYEMYYYELLNKHSK